MVCATARSGSNFFTDGLHATRKAGRPKQFFLPKFEGEYGAAHGLDPVADFAGYVRGIVPSTATSNEVFGFKVMGWYLQDFLERLKGAFPELVQDGKLADRKLLESLFPRLQFVRIVRKNKLRQAISKAKALQSGLWKVQEGNAANAEPVFDFELIQRCLEETLTDEMVWSKFFEAQQIEPLTVVYEDLCAEYDLTIRSTMRFFGVSIPRSPRIEPATVLQSDSLSLEWEQLYLKAVPAKETNFQNPDV
jgi:LPS sulfotransferase NodH